MIQYAPVVPHRDVPVAHAEARRVYVLLQTAPSLQVLATADSFERLEMERQEMVALWLQEMEAETLELRIESANHLEPFA